MSSDWLRPDWPAPENVKALVTTRSGGVSLSPFDSMNLGEHVGDQSAAVARNREILQGETAVEPLWLTQVHGTQVVQLGEVSAGVQADAAVSRLPKKACVVMTADCLPVLFCDRSGTVVAAAHAGWRGLCAGVLESTVAAMKTAPEEILAWLGPAIGPAAFEVGDEVRTAFISHSAAASAAFQKQREGKWLCDLYLLARQRLEGLGLAAVSGGGLCTFSDARRFYSYRRDGVTGRMASMVWLNRPPFPR